VNNKKSFTASLGYSRQGRSLNAHYFPGTSNKRALIIGGVHGSELSAIEVAKAVIQMLTDGPAPYYSVVVIPCLFPDNEFTAKNDSETIGSVLNNGRYSNEETADPNRQMPALGKAFNTRMPVDYLGRYIEEENQVLLQLINDFRPERIVNLHAIRDVKLGGIYADPRTDSEGYALGFQSDSSLAITMARFISNNGGTAPGNQLDCTPTALYYTDPVPAPAGSWQKRNIHGSKLPFNRGQGVSLGSWASTAVCDSRHPSMNRGAIRLITLEFPGCKRPIDYTDVRKKNYTKKLVSLYASSVRMIFLENYFPEEKQNDPGENIRKNIPESFLAERN